MRIHGGRIDAAALLYPSAPQPWIDLSTGINPVAVAGTAKSRSTRYQRLPLASEIAEMTRPRPPRPTGFPANAAIVPVSGSEIAIRLLPRMIGTEPGRHPRADLWFARRGLARRRRRGT